MNRVQVPVELECSAGLLRLQPDDDGGGGEEGAAADAKSTVTVSDDPELGAILVDGDGFTLYVLTRDEPDVSTCTGGCARSWPPLIAPGDQAPLAGEGVEPGLLGTFTREDGSKQVTYGRQPLYNFSGDREAGSTRGQGVSQVWFTISPAGEPITE